MHDQFALVKTGGFWLVVSGFWFLVFGNISAECDRVPEEATKRRSDEGVKAQTYAQVVLRRGGAAKLNLPTANSQ